MSDLKTAFIGFYLTDKEKAKVQIKADDDNRTVSDWVRNLVVDACSPPLTEAFFEEARRKARSAKATTSD